MNNLLFRNVICKGYYIKIKGKTVYLEDFKED